MLVNYYGYTSNGLLCVLPMFGGEDIPSPCNLPPIHFPLEYLSNPTDYLNNHYPRTLEGHKTEWKMWFSDEHKGRKTHITCGPGNFLWSWSHILPMGGAPTQCFMGTRAKVHQKK